MADESSSETEDCLVLYRYLDRMHCTSHTVLGLAVLVVQVTYIAASRNTDPDLDEITWYEANLGEPFAADNGALVNAKDLDMKYGSEDSGFKDLAPYEALPTDKRYARLSYGNYGRGSRRRNYHSSRYYANYYKPWMNLPNTECFRRRCNTDKHCCRRYSKCDRSAHVCYSCWYGHPCKNSRDCCERYPYCSPQTKTCKA